MITNPHFRVRADHCLTGSGAELNPYYIVETGSCAHVVALDRDERVVMVSQYRHGSRDVSLELPGGVVEGDENIQDAGARELLEETGFETDALELVFSSYSNPARYNGKIHFFFGSGARLRGISLPDPTEEIEVHLIPLTHAIELALTGTVIPPSHVAGLLTAVARKRPHYLRAVIDVVDSSKCFP